MSVFTGKWNPGVYLFNQINKENHFGIERNAVGMYVSHIHGKHPYTCNNCLQTFGRPSKIQYLMANRMFGQRTTGAGKNQTVDLNSLPYWNPSWPWQPLSALSHLSKAFPCEANLLAGQQLSVSCHCANFRGSKSLKIQDCFWKLWISTPFLVLGLCRTCLFYWWFSAVFFFGGGGAFWPKTCRFLAVFPFKKGLEQIDSTPPDPLDPLDRPDCRGSPWTLPSRNASENEGSNDVYRAVEGEEVWRVLEEALQCLGTSKKTIKTECVAFFRPERGRNSIKFGPSPQFSCLTKKKWQKKSGNECSKTTP